MADAESHGLADMPAIDTCIAALVVSPDEALRPHPRCPSVECRRTDELLTKAHNTATRVGRLSNSLAHLMLALQASPPEQSTERVTEELLNTALQTIGYIAQDTGRLVATLVRSRRQVWLAQTPLPEPCRATLRALPLVLGHVFGPKVKEALDRRTIMSEARRKEAAQRPSSFRAPAPPIPRPSLPQLSGQRAVRQPQHPGPSPSPRGRQGQSRGSIHKHAAKRPGFGPRR